MPQFKWSLYEKCDINNLCVMREKDIMQEKYWKYMVQIKHWIFYLDLYVEDSYKWDKRINIFGVIASSTSIAA